MDLVGSYGSQTTRKAAEANMPNANPSSKSTVKANYTAKKGVNADLEPVRKSSKEPRKPTKVT